MECALRGVWLVWSCCEYIVQDCKLENTEEYMLQDSKTYGIKALTMLGYLTESMSLNHGP